MSTRKEYMKAYRESHKAQFKEYKKLWREQHKEHIKDLSALYESESRNINGERLGYIRTKSQRILKKCHGKIKGYEIHHCFGYTEADKFIYIPKFLHLKIHALLRELNIDSKINHWKYISELVNNCEQYTYIKS